MSHTCLHLLLFVFLFLSRPVTASPTSAPPQSDQLAFEAIKEVGVVFGEQYDPDLGLYYLRARFYDSVSGRFWSADSWEGDESRPLTLNKYGYVEGNPINRIDPSGHISMGSIGASMAIGAGLGGIGNMVAHKALNQTITISTFFEGAALGAVLGPGILVPSTALGLGIGGMGVGFSFMPIMLSPDTPPGQRIAAGFLAAMGAVGGRHSIKGAASPQPTQTVTLYRAIGKAELMDIATSGELRAGNGSMNNKWFSERAGDASTWGKRFFKWDKEPVWLLQIKVPRHLADQMAREPNLDGIGPARSASISQLQQASNQSEMSILTGNRVPAPN